MLSQDTLARFATPEFRAFLDAGVKVCPDDHYTTALSHAAVRYADAAIVEAYHRLALLFDASPHLEALRPIFMPVVEPSDKSVVVRVRLELTTRAGEKSTRKEYALDEYPAVFGAKAQRACYEAVDACERATMNGWDHVHTAALFHRDTPYANATQVVQEMESDVGCFLAELRQWALDTGLPASSRAAPAARM